MASLVVVESPAKAKTLARLLGAEYVTEATYGHVRDLPESASEIPSRLKKEKWARIGVNVEEEFEPLYVIPASKREHVKRLKQAVGDADELILATDEDREGESISWHVLEILKPKIPVHRIAFHEITKRAILEALENPRELDQNLVRAQESRRILDRLFGYQLSPLLWKKVARGLSAGRVQSVAVRLCVMRERERRSFVKATYFDIETEYEENGKSFGGRLVRLDDSRVATGKDFDPDTGQPRPRSKAVWLRSEEEVRELVGALHRHRPFRVASVESKPTKQRPAPPFTTSSLQQEANRKLGFSAKYTMQVAQRLYEGIEIGGDRAGIITYMRTDSVVLSDVALGDAERLIRDKFGPEYTTGWRKYVTKSANAQEAHEAVRPVEIARTPDSLSRHLSKDERRLYELIWNRTVASQMADARILRTSVEITGELDGERQGLREATFVSTGKQIEFPGYLRVYVEGGDDPEADLADRESILPVLEVGQSIDPKSIELRSHETSPPARYTEASLVKTLEAEGIGRPSTYASIIDTIQQRRYVVKQGNALIPTFTAFAVTELLEKHFHDYVDTRFTARLEQKLDDVATGNLDWKEHLEAFYHGEPGDPGLDKRISAEEPKIDFPAFEVGEEPESGQPVVVKVGRYGPYLQMPHPDDPGEKLIASIGDDVPPADLTIETAVEILRKKAEGPRRVGDDPETGLPIYALTGRYGPYVQLGETPTDKGAEKPKRASLPKGTSEDDVTLEEAVQLLSLPRVLGSHPETGEEIIANNGRYRPYVKHQGDYRSLEPQDDVFTITLERALELFKKPKRGRGAATVLRDLGSHPSGEGNIQILDGRYGPYVTDGELNASLPRDADPEAMTLQEAVRLLEEKGKPPKRKTKKKSSKKKSSKTGKKKTGRKKSGASSDGARKASGRKTTVKKAGPGPRAAKKSG